MRYGVEGGLSVEEVVKLYRDAGLQGRPVDDPSRMATMIDGSDVLVVARDDDDRLVGLARSVTDGAYVTYLSDLAVTEMYRGRGVGRELIERTRQAAPQAKLVLLAAPAARTYYPHLGFTVHESAWWLPPLEP